MTMESYRRVRVFIEIIIAQNTHKSYNAFVYLVLLGEKNMLKLVINNTQPFPGKASFQGNKAKSAPLTSPLQNSLPLHFRRLSHNLYAFSHYDLDHKLDCKMNVDLRESYAYAEGEPSEDKYLVPVAFCNFPNIDIRRLTEKVYGDDYLQGAIMVQFQLKILEQLLLFCKEKDADHLVLTINNTDYDDLEIYRHFATSEEQVVTEEGEQTEIAIATDVENYDEVIDFMDEFSSDFQKTLWRNQTINPIFRKYLIEHSLPVQ